MPTNQFESDSKSQLFTVIEQFLYGMVLDVFQNYPVLTRKAIVTVL